MTTEHTVGTSQAGEGSLIQTHNMVWISLFAALMVVGSYAHFPLGPVPISLQVLFVLMAGFVLGLKGGSLAVGLYILAGLVGLPVFYGGHGGLGHVLGPTGGYLVGFIPAVVITGWGGQKIRKQPLPWTAGVGIALGAYLAIYAVGLTWLRQILDIGWAKAATIGMFPFLPSDVLQIIICISAVRYMQKHGLVPRA
ncbi:MAG: biotin transporter BioY [Desulfovermiculus sp.]|nr:biotin transporter BioY [Desulfovermiculus sp.]